MNKSVITYEIKPALDHSNQLTVDILWNYASKQYFAVIEKGCFSQIKIRWIDRDHELKNIVSESAELHLPIFAEGAEGLDGTTYVFKCGDYPITSEFSWWVDLPPEWIELEPIITKINALVKRAFAESKKYEEKM